MSSRMSQFEDEEDVYLSNYSDEGTPDPLDDFLDRYTVVCNPELRVKFKKRLDKVVLSASLGIHGPGVLLTVKPSHRQQQQHQSDTDEDEGGGFLSHPRAAPWWRKLVLDPGRQGLSLYTRKFRLGNLLDVQLEAHSSKEQRFGLSWRVFPKWSKANNKLTYKWRHNLSEPLQFRAHMTCSLGWPELGGQIGGGGSPSMEYEQGYCHVDIPRLELVLDLDEQEEQQQQRNRRRKRQQQQQEQQAQRGGDANVAAAAGSSSSSGSGGGWGAGGSSSRGGGNGGERSGGRGGLGSSGSDGWGKGGFGKGLRLPWRPIEDE